MDAYISTDKERLDLPMIHSYISGSSYWGKGRTMAQVKNTIEHSLCFGMYMQEWQQIGFGRVVSDRTVFAYLMDLFILGPYQHRGFGKKLLFHIMDHEAVRHVRTVALKTRDAHGLYEDAGFERVGDSSLWMSKERQSLTETTG